MFTRVDTASDYTNDSGAIQCVLRRRYPSSASQPNRSWPQKSDWMSSLIRNNRIRVAVVSTMLFGMLAVMAAPFVRPTQGSSTDAAARWLLDRLHVTPDADFDAAVSAALASSPASFDEFVEAFVSEYSGADSFRVRLARAFGYSDAAFRHFLALRVVLAPAAVKSFRTKAHLAFAALDVAVTLRLVDGLGRVVALSWTEVPGASAVLFGINSALPNGP